MIYLDSSVVLDEQVQPPESLWGERLVSSRLLQYEIWNRVHAYGHAERLAERVHTALNVIVLIDFSEDVLERALKPFPLAPRTLDSLHLATADFVRREIGAVALATYDRRLAKAATALGMPLVALE